jgi:hemoglobin/transferrin/lactoferrin receptor protein
VVTLLAVHAGVEDRTLHAQEPLRLARATLSESDEKAGPVAGTISGSGPFQALLLKDTVVTATRRSQEIFNVPYAVDLIDEEDIRDRRLARIMTQVFMEDPGIMVQMTARGQGSPYIRGFTGYHTLFLVDGIRLNNSVFRPGPNEYWNLVDPFTISRIEVVKGPSSVLYGSDAIGGTANAITRGRESFEKGFHGDGGILYRYSSADNGHVGRLEGSANAGSQLGVLGGFSYKYFDDLTAGRDVGRQPETGYDQFGGDVKTSYLFSPKAELVLAYQHVVQEHLWRTHKTVYGIRWEGTTVGDEKQRILDYERQLAYAQFLARDIGSLVDSIKLSLSFQRLDKERFRLRSDDRTDEQGFDVGTLGFLGQLGSNSPIGYWTYGVEYYRDSVDSFRTDYMADGSLKEKHIQGPVADDAAYDLLGVFCQDEIPILDNLVATAGVRYNYAAADAEKVEDPVTGEQISISDSWNNVVGSLRLMYGLKPWLNLYAGVSQGFRAPNLSDLTRFDSARTDEIETPSPGLDPEKYLAYEIGVKVHHKRVQGEVAYFYTDIDDMIDRFLTGNVIDEDNEVRKANVGDGFVQGVDFRFLCPLADEWALHGALSWTEGEIDTFPASDPVIERKPMSRVPPLSGTVGILWEDLSEKYWAEALVMLAAEQDRLSPRDASDTQRIPPGGTPGYVVFTIRGGVRVTRGLLLSAMIENVTNEDYRIHGSGINAPGTNAVLAVDWTF